MRKTGRVGNIIIVKECVGGRVITFHSHYTSGVVFPLLLSFSLFLLRFWSRSILLSWFPVMPAPAACSHLTPTKFLIINLWTAQRWIWAIFTHKLAYFSGNRPRHAAGNTACGSGERATWTELSWVALATRSSVKTIKHLIRRVHGSKFSSGTNFSFRCEVTEWTTISSCISMFYVFVRLLQTNESKSRDHSCRSRPPAWWMEIHCCWIRAAGSFQFVGFCSPPCFYTYKLIWIWRLDLDLDRLRNLTVKRLRTAVQHVITAVEKEARLIHEGETNLMQVRRTRNPRRTSERFNDKPQRARGWGSF